MADIGSLDITALTQAMERAAKSVLATYSARPAKEVDVVTPDLLSEALHQYTEILMRLEADRGTGEGLDGTPMAGTVSPEDVSELGNYGLGLLSDMAQWAGELQLAREQQQLQALSVPLALWVARRGGSIEAIEPVVNALAATANTTNDPRRLRELAGVMGEVIAATAPAISGDLDRSNPARPWRVLNLNRGIVATRSHDAKLMEQVFEELGRFLPDDAPAFFEEGMKQMDAMDFPPPVRAVMERFHNKWANPTLH